MKQYQFRYTDSKNFRRRIAALKREIHPRCRVIFHVFAECWADQEILQLRRMIREELPDAFFAGAASFGNICNGKLTRRNIVVAATVFELEDTRVETFCYELSPEEARASAKRLVSDVAQRPWVRAVELFTMADVATTAAFCEVLASLPPQIEIFGGKSRFLHSPDAPRYVIDSSGRCVSSAVVAVLYGGPGLHIQTNLIQGWKPLGRPMKVTRSEGDILYELDGRPAHELYYKYLHIKNDENFFYNTLEFPFLFYHNDVPVIRIPHSCREDGAMVLSATIPQNDYVRIAFGDSDEIRRNVLMGGRVFEPFRPEAVFLYSCGCRRTFWGDQKCNRETKPFTGLAPTFGYYTGGELLRREGVVREHNATLVIAAMREGDAAQKKPAVFGMDETIFAEKDSLVTRFSYFIAAAIDELEEANRRLELLSITDGLTGLLNRREAERRILESCENGAGPAGCLLMIDLDDFKKINDEYGHQEGDLVLQKFSGILRECVESESKQSVVGRWGGEEFIALLKEPDESGAARLADEIRQRFKECLFEKSGCHTVSIGVSCIGEEERAGAALSRVDRAMYEAKRRGKDRVVLL